VSTADDGPPPVIRPARADELGRLQAIEVAAGARFAEVGMPDVADDAPPPRSHLDRYRRDGRLWVITDGDDRPVGYATARVVDGAGHLDQLSVLPGHQRRGLGRQLVDHVDRWAAALGLPALTLSTFRHVPWNGPWYERLGFTVVPEEQLGPGLRATRRRERRAGLDVSRRQFMRRPTGR
jgi:GNAT superfamily N-acetyltransferase